MDSAFGLYLHIPFCAAKCAYCDFNSYAGQDELMPQYVEALLAEAALWSKASAGRTVQTLYFGGGTPSLLEIDEVERLMAGLRGSFQIATEAEVSLEANPDSVDYDYLRALRGLGVNRLSLGVQSFDDTVLRFLGRIHTAAEAEEAYEEARDAGFDSVSIDLIYGIPSQSLDHWQDTLDQAVRLEPHHMSLYALTIEEKTPLAAMIEARSVPWPSDDDQADMYDWSVERMAEAGYAQYEISNWARPEHECRHNLTYWRNQPYLGLGAGAHSSFNGYRFANERTPARYIELVAASSPLNGDALDLSSLRHVESVEEPDAEREMSDTVILGLRTTEGVSLAAFEERFGLPLEDRYGREVRELTELGLVEVREGRLRLTDGSLLLANEASLRFLP